MTNEEFDGHLMAALHGPNAEAIAARMLVLLVPGLAPTLKDINGAVYELSVLAHLAGLKPKEPRAMIELAGTRRGFTEGIRARLRSIVGKLPDAQEHAAEIMLDLDNPREIDEP